MKETGVVGTPHSEHVPGYLEKVDLGCKGEIWYKVDGLSGLNGTLSRNGDKEYTPVYRRDPGEKLPSGTVP